METRVKSKKVAARLEEVEKIRPLPGRQLYFGAYRGELLIDWELRYHGSKQLEVYSIQCPNKKCRQWWGFTYFIDKARRLLETMRRIKGCPKCRKKKRT